MESDDKKPKKAVTKPIWTSQMAIIRIVAKCKDKTIVVWENENVNSVFGHLPLRHTGQKEEIG